MERKQPAMDEAREDPDDTSGDVDESSSDDGTELDIATSTTLVEISPGMAVVFGDVPEGLELLEMDFIPSFDRARLNSALGALGNVGTIVGNVGEAIAGAQGLYRVNEATLSILQSGGQLAAKEGAKLGAIFKNGQVVAQARFIPASMTAATAIAAIGPAVAMLALQMQLGEISGLVRTNIALTTETLKTIRNEQWSELEALIEAVDEAADHVRSIESVPDSVWESIAASYPALRKQMKLYRRNVSGYVKELGVLQGRSRREYLESNAEAMVFDTYALLGSLKAYGEYQAVKAMRARARSATDVSEAQLFERITQSTPIEIHKAREEIGDLTEALVRELRIIAELPGRATVPLTKKRKDAKASRLTCEKLLGAVEPLANSIQIPVDMPDIPGILCVPEDLDLEPYLRVLRWYLNRDEILHGIAFPYEARGVAAAMPPILAKSVDASWDALGTGKLSAVVEVFASSTFVAVTDQRVLTATPRSLLREGELRDVISLGEIRYVRPRQNQKDSVRPAINVATEQSDIRWMFPAAADSAHIDQLSTSLGVKLKLGSGEPLQVEAASPNGREEGPSLEGEANRPEG